MEEERREAWIPEVGWDVVLLCHGLAKRSLGKGMGC